MHWQLEKLLQLSWKFERYESQWSNILVHCCVCAYMFWTTRLYATAAAPQLQHRSRENISTHNIIVLNLEPIHKLKEYFPFTRQLIFFCGTVGTWPDPELKCSVRKRESVCEREMERERELSKSVLVQSQSLSCHSAIGATLIGWCNSALIWLDQSMVACWLPLSWEERESEFSALLDGSFSHLTSRGQMVWLYLKLYVSS